MGKPTVTAYSSPSPPPGFVHTLIYSRFASGNISYRNYSIKRVMIAVLLITIYKSQNFYYMNYIHLV